MSEMSKEKCNQRARIAAMRHRVNATSFRFIGDSYDDTTRGFIELRHSGSLPKNNATTIDLINSKLPEGAEKLSIDDVYIHYMESANSNYIPDRSMHLAESTLKNIARDASAGVAFMNSHRAGGLSSPAELPFGRTFAGQFQEGVSESGIPVQRTVIGYYMRRGVHPNGAGGPSTDDLDAGIRAGTIFDVSVGLRGGEYFCNVCGNNLDALDENGKYLCQHAPGTHHEMSKDEIQSIKENYPTNTKGVASYSIYDASLGEVSAVYDGAVPGAGINKVMSLAKSGTMTKEDLKSFMTEALEQYGHLFPFNVSDVLVIKEDDCSQHSNCDTIESTGDKSMQGNENDNNKELLDPGTEDLSTGNPQEPAEQEPAPALELAPQKTQADMEFHRRNAKYFVQAQLSANKILPASADHLTELFAHCSSAGIVEKLEDFVDGLPSHNLTKNVIPPTDGRLGTLSQPSQDSELDEMVKADREFVRNQGKKQG